MGITKAKTRTNNIFNFDTLELKQYPTKTYKIEFYVSSILFIFQLLTLSLFLY